MLVKMDETIRRQSVAIFRRAGSRGLSTLDQVVYSSLMRAHPPGCAKMEETPRKGSSIGCAAGGLAPEMVVLGVRAPGVPKQGQREGVYVGCGECGAGCGVECGCAARGPSTMHDAAGARHRQ